MRHGRARHETPSSRSIVPTTRPVALGLSPLAALEFARLPSGGAGPREARYGARGECVGVGATLGAGARAAKGRPPGRWERHALGVSQASAISSRSVGPQGIS